MSGLSVALTAGWAALHTLQYGFGISAFNGIQDAVICPATKSSRGGSWVTPCIPLTVSHFLAYWWERTELKRRSGRDISALRAQELKSTVEPIRPDSSHLYPWRSRRRARCQPARQAIWTDRHPADFGAQRLDRLGIHGLGEYVPCIADWPVRLCPIFAPHMRSSEQWAVS